MFISWTVHVFRRQSTAPTRMCSTLREKLASLAVGQARRARRRTKLLIVRQPPEQGVRIQKKPHGTIPSLSAMSAGNSSKSAEIWICPLSVPGRRCSAR